MSILLRRRRCTWTGLSVHFHFWTVSLVPTSYLTLLCPPLMTIMLRRRRCTWTDRKVSRRPSATCSRRRSSEWPGTSSLLNWSEWCVMTSYFFCLSGKWRMFIWETGTTWWWCKFLFQYSTLFVNKFFFIFLHFVENFRICRGLKRLTILQKHFMAGGCSLKLLVIVLVLSLNYSIELPNYQQWLGKFLN